MRVDIDASEVAPNGIEMHRNPSLRFGDNVTKSPMISVCEMVFSPRRSALRPGAARRAVARRGAARCSARNLGPRVVAEILAEIWVAGWCPKFWVFGSTKNHFTH